MDPFGIKDALDILLAAPLLFYLYRIMKESGTINIFFGVLAFIAVWVVASEILEMRLIGNILDKFMNIGLLILVILFQDQIKRFLVELGSHRRWRFIKKIFNRKGNVSIEDNRHKVMPIVYACMNMAKSKTGALIVIEQNVSLDNYERTGDIIDAQINSRLIENIFFKNSPLHDGAIVIEDGRISAAGCLLPLTRRHDMNGELGTRHRAALGMSEVSDAIIIVVSEETGMISVAFDCSLTRGFSADSLRRYLLKKLLKVTDDTGSDD